MASMFSGEGRGTPGIELCIFQKMSWTQAVCQAGPEQQQIEVSDGSGAGGSSLVCERLGVKSLIFHRQSSVALGKP